MDPVSSGSSLFGDVFGPLSASVTYVIVGAVAFTLAALVIACYCCLRRRSKNAMYDDLENQAKVDTRNEMNVKNIPGADLDFVTFDKERKQQHELQRASGAQSALAQAERSIPNTTPDRYVVPSNAPTIQLPISRSSYLLNPEPRSYYEDANIPPTVNRPIPTALDEAEIRLPKPNVPGTVVADAQMIVPATVIDEAEIVPAVIPMPDDPIGASQWFGAMLGEAKVILPTAKPKEPEEIDAVMDDLLKGLDDFKA